MLQSMLTVNSSKRACADDILNNKILQLRAQDYSYRNSFSQAKLKIEKLTEESKQLSAKIDEQNKVIKQSESLNTAAVELDRHILEMQSKLKQLRFSNSHSDSANKKLSMFRDNNSSLNLPLQNID